MLTEQSSMFLGELLGTFGRRRTVTPVRPGLPQSLEHDSACPSECAADSGGGSNLILSQALEC